MAQNSEQHMQELSSLQDQVARARRFLTLFARPAAAINTKRNSYAIKHTAEHLEGYISQEALIQAAKELGYRTRPAATPAAQRSVYFNMSISRGVEYYLRYPYHYRPRGSHRMPGGEVRRRFASDAEEQHLVNWLKSRPKP